MRVRFSLGKLLFCVAVYALPLGLLSGYGYEGIWHALAIGTSLSGVILLTNDANFRLVVDVYVGGILGAFIGWGFLSGPFDTTQQTAAAGAAGALVGGLIGGALSRRGRPPNGAADSSAPPEPPKNADSE